MSTANQSPFFIRPEDLQCLEASKPFQVLRSYLAVNATNGLCHEHACCPPEAQSTWLLHRDILHALIMPVVQLFHRASRLAEAALCSSKSEDFEMAFTGDARSGFLWLQCFLADEEAWCQSIGCPACIVTSTLSTEQHLRIAFTALSLANESSHASSPDQSLPSLPFFADALHYAIDTDPFWESYPGASSAFESSAQKLTAHIHALMEQCGEVEALVSDYDATPTDSATSSHLVKFQRGQPVRAPSGFLRIGAESKCPAVKPSRMARRQQRMRQEEQMLLQRLVVQCWGQVALAGVVPGALDRAHVKALMRGAVNANGFLLGTGSSSSFGEKRRRSLTCP